MTTTQPTGASDAAIAQAFREITKSSHPGMWVEAIGVYALLMRAREIDALTSNAEGGPMMKCVCTLEGQGCTSRCDRGQPPPVPAMKVTIPATPPAQVAGSGIEYREWLSVASDLDKLAADGWICASVAAQYIRDHEAITAQPASVDAQETLRQICDLLGIGEGARTPAIILTNITNIKRFAEYLHAIEREFLMGPGEPDDDYPDDEPEPECLVNLWGARDEADYVEQFRAALKALAAQPAPVVGGLGVLADKWERKCDEEKASRSDYRHGKGDGYDACATELRAALSARPAVEGAQGASGGGHLPEDGAYLICYDDQDEADELFAYSGARENAFRRYRDRSSNWKTLLTMVNEIADKSKKVTESHTFIFTCAGKITAFKKSGNLTEARKWSQLLVQHLKDEGLLQI